MNLEEKTVSSELKFQGKVLSLREDVVELPDGTKSKREVVNHNGAVGVVALTDKNEIILVRQFRAGIQDITLELPAGKLEKGEEPLECGKRELVEETGFSAKKFQKLTQIATSPAILQEIIYIFLATDLVKGDKCPDEGEFVETITIPICDAKKMVLNGEITDAKTVVGILLANENINKN